MGYMMGAMVMLLEAVDDGWTDEERSCVVLSCVCVWVCPSVPCAKTPLCFRATTRRPLAQAQPRATLSAANTTTTIIIVIVIVILAPTAAALRQT